MLWPLVRLAVRRGAIEPPESDGWTRGLVHIARWTCSGTPIPTAHRGLLDDADLLEDEVAAISVDCVVGANAGVWVAKTDASSRPGWDRTGNRWTHALLRLSRKDGSTASASSTPRSTR